MLCTGRVLVLKGWVGLSVLCTARTFSLCPCLKGWVGLSVLCTARTFSLCPCLKGWVGHGAA